MCSSIGYLFQFQLLRVFEISANFNKTEVWQLVQELYRHSVLYSQLSNGGGGNYSCKHNFFYFWWILLIKYSLYYFSIEVISLNSLLYFSGQLGRFLIKILLFWLMGLYLYFTLLPRESDWTIPKMFSTTKELAKFSDITRITTKIR